MRRRGPENSAANGVSSTRSAPRSRVFSAPRSPDATSRTTRFALLVCNTPSSAVMLPPRHHCRPQGMVRAIWGS